jgi:hypothetical protein
MSRKLLAGGLLLVVGLGLTMADRVSSQDKGDFVKDGKGGAFDLAAGSADLDQMVLELRNVRRQKVDLDRREKQLMAAIENRINAERQQLDQKIQERRKQLDEIERLLHPDARLRDTGARDIDRKK